MVPKPGLKKLHAESSISSLSGISQNKTFCEAKQCKIYKCINFTFFSCAAHTVHVLAGYFFLLSPPETIFSSLCILKSPKSQPGGSCLDPLGVACFSGNWRLSELDLVLFWILMSRTFVPRAGSSCTFLFVCV